MHCMLCSLEDSKRLARCFVFWFLFLHPVTRVFEPVGSFEMRGRVVVSKLKLMSFFS